MRFAPQYENEPPKFVIVSLFSETDRFQEAVAEADRFKDRGSNSECMCCGHPGIDWWKGDELLARTAVQHLKVLRWKRFHGDAELTQEASDALTAWFAARRIKAAK